MSKSSRVRTRRVLSLALVFIMMLSILGSSGYTVFADDMFGDEVIEDVHDHVCDDGDCDLDHDHDHDHESEAVPEEDESDDPADPEPGTEEETEVLREVIPEAEEESAAEPEDGVEPEGVDAPVEAAEPDSDPAPAADLELPVEPEEIAEPEAAIESDEADATEGEEALMKAAPLMVKAPAKVGSFNGTVLAFTSDTHNTVNNESANRLGVFIDAVTADYGEIEVLGIGGDLSDTHNIQPGEQTGSGSTQPELFWSNSQNVMDVVSGKGITHSVYTTGNHEYENGQFGTYTGSQDTQGAYKLNQVAETGDAGDNYVVYALGSQSSANSYPATWITNLENELTKSEYNGKTIIVLSHYPLHYISSRTIGNADLLINALNNVADASDDRNVIFLWGHNHSQANNSEQNYDKIREPGYSIAYKSGSSIQSKFFYAAAGCMCDGDYNSSNNTNAAGNVKGKGIAITINSRNEIELQYYKADGTKLTTTGAYYSNQTADPVPANNVVINEAGTAGTPQPVTMGVGGSTQLHITLEPANATYDSITWTSGDETIATVVGNGLTAQVTGVAAGETTITVSVDNGSGAKAVLTAEIPVVVAESSSEESYYVITINDTHNNTNYALSCVTSPNTYNNYSGLTAIPNYEYDPEENDPNLLWSLEAVPGTENGYKIKNKNGGYLSATYNNTDGGDLVVGDTEDIWTIDGGLDAWTNSGSKLHSSNAAVNDPDHSYLVVAYHSKTTPPIASEAFFTVRTATDDVGHANISILNLPIPVTNVSIDESSASVAVGKSLQLHATVEPENASYKTVVWSSNDSSIASVDENGLIRGVSKGTTTITATVFDNIAGLVFTDSIEVTVEQPPVYVLTDTLTAGNDYLIVNRNSAGTGYALYYTLNGSGTTATVAARQIEVISGIEATEDKPYIEGVDTSFTGIWAAGTGSTNGTYTLGNNGWFLRSSNRNALTITKDTSRRDWTWNGTNNRLSNNNRYLRFNNNTFSLNTATNSVYLYVKTEIETCNHDWEFVDFTWTGLAAIANYVCKNDSSHTQTVPARVSGEYFDPTCTEASYTVYTATVTSSVSLDGSPHNESKTLANTPAGWYAADSLADGTYIITFTDGGREYAMYLDGNYVKYEDITDTGVDSLGDAYKWTAAYQDGTPSGYYMRSVSNATRYMTYQDYNGQYCVNTSADNSYRLTYDVNHHLSYAKAPDLVPYFVCSLVANRPYPCLSTNEANAVTVTLYSYRAEGQSEPATGHTAGTAVQENVVDATCTAAGSYDEVVYCEVCGAELSRESKTIPVKSHTLTKTDAVAATCTAAGNIDYWTCSECHKLFSDANGTTEIALTDTVIPATGHSWGSPTYTWAADNSTATAERVCANDASHVETVNAIVTKTAGTGADAGKVIYTATATFDGTDYTDVKKVDTYTITWINEDSTVLETDTGVEAGTTPTYDGATPTKVADDTNTYTFNNWTPAVAPAIADTTYTATFTATPINGAPVPGGGAGGGGGGGGAAGGGEEPDPGEIIDDPTTPLAGITAKVVGLNSVDHFAYVSGYPDGTVHPEANITRYETACMLYGLLTDELRKQITTDNTWFPDVLQDEWYSIAVDSLTNGGYIAGLPGGIYGGDRDITRAEFVALLTGFLEWQGIPACTFDDVEESYWAYEQIGLAEMLGWIAGKGNNRFCPTDNITRAEAITIINHALNRGVDSHSDLSHINKFSDNADPTAWYYYEIIEASNTHNYSDVRPNEVWTQ